MENLLIAIEKNLFEDVEKMVKEISEPNTLDLEECLLHSRSDEMTKLLKKIIKRKKFEYKFKDSLQFVKTGLKNDKGLNLDNEVNDKKMTEDEAIKKYVKDNKKLERATLLIFNSFKANIINIENERAASISYEIIKLMNEKFKDSFPRIVRTKTHNLKENSRLCKQVYDLKISPVEFVEMSISEMKSDEIKIKDDTIIKDSILSSQVAKPIAETDLFECGKCKQKKCTYSQLQTRSCDEPMTTFVYCTVCGNRWKF